MQRRAAFHNAGEHFFYFLPIIAIFFLDSQADRIPMFLKLRRTSDPSDDEQDLLREYRETGDLRILGKLYERHMEMLYAVCYKYLRDEDEAKDAVMAIFEELIEKARTHTIANWKSWLHSVAKNYCLMQLRSEKIRVDDFFDDDRMESAVFPHLEDDSAEKESTFRYLEKCLEQLNPEQKTTVSLFFLKEKSYRQITEETGYDPNQVKSYLQNGRRNLKLCMDNAS